MEDNLKGKFILVLGILCAIFLLLWVSSCNDVRKFRSARDSEMNQRLDSEQKLGEYSKQKTTLEEKLAKAESAIADEKANLETTKKALLQEQLMSNSLKSELDKISKLKDQLEADLKSAMAKTRTAAPDKSKK